MQLIIVDRREDPLTPLMHDYTYQAMAYDIMDIRDDRYSYAYSNAKGEQVQKETLLNEQDVLWPKLRHLHIADAITSVLDDFNSFTRESKVLLLCSLHSLCAVIFQAYLPLFCAAL